VDKIKIVISAIGAALLFILGIFAGRTGRHNKSGIDSAIDGEGELQDDIGAAERREANILLGIADLEGRVNETAAGVRDLEAGISDTDRLAQRLKERNDLE